MAMESENGTLLDGLLTREQVAEQLSLSVDTLGRWATQRKGPPVTKIGPRVYYRRESLARWIKDQEIKSPRAERR